MLALRRVRNLRFYSVIDKLKGAGFTEFEAKEIIESIDMELMKLTEGYATQEQLKKLQSTLDDKISAASIFVTSTSPFQMNFSSNLTASNNSIVPLMNPAIDPLLLEKEIKTTGQQLNDEIKQLQADYQLEANLEVKRQEKEDLELELKLETSSEYAADRVKQLNEHLDRVSRQALTAIGGFIGVLTTVFISYSLLSN